MISSKPRLVVPMASRRCLRELAELFSNQTIKHHPICNHTFVAFKKHLSWEVMYLCLIFCIYSFRNNSLDIKDLVKQFHQLKGKCTSDTTQEKKPEFVKETRRNQQDHPVSLFNTEFPQTEGTSEAVHGPSSKPVTPKTTTPTLITISSSCLSRVAYVPADPAQFATQMLALATSEAGQPPPYSNMWTLYCLTDMNQQSRPSPPPAPGPFPQATLYLSNPKDPQFLQNPPQVTSPTYVMMDDSKKTSAPPFILVGSNVQEAQDWKPLPGHAVVSQSDGMKRYAAVQVPIAIPADQKFQKHTLNPPNASPPTSGKDVPRPQSPVFLSVAFPVEDVAKKGSGSGDKRSPFGSYGIAGEITVTTAHVRRAETKNW
uniref:Calcium binding tyrosine phosphorylation regulated n=1 Tax=Sciurus vulgaris TaxID=55149 RepID=A0A8D2BEL3_SCIVU